MPKLKFYDLQKRESFSTDNYKVVVKGGRKMAIASTPSGGKSSRFLPKDFKK